MKKKISIIIALMLLLSVNLNSFAEVNKTIKSNKPILNIKKNIKPTKNMTKTIIFPKKAKVVIVSKKKVVQPKKTQPRILTKAEMAKLPLGLSDLYKINDGMRTGKTLAEEHNELLDFLGSDLSAEARNTHNTDAIGLNSLMVKMANDYMTKTLNFDYKKGLNYYTNLTKDFYSINTSGDFIRNFKNQINCKIVSEAFFYTKENLTYSGNGLLVRGEVRIIFHSGTQDYLKSEFERNMNLNQWYEIPYEVDIQADQADALRHLKVNGVIILKNHIKEINLIK